MGKKGGAARAANLTARQRSASASEAARARWAAYYKLHPEKLKLAKAKKKAAK